MKTLHLDPTVAKQLQAPVGHEAEVQRLLDNPQEITHFLDFRVDWAFKYILGHEEILVKLLNDLLPVHVDTVKYLPNEIPVVSEKEKRSVFDVICTNEKTGERFLCEMQRQADTDMDERLLFYGSSLIQKQIERRAKKYRLQPVYVQLEPSHTYAPNINDKFRIFQIKIQVFFQNFTFPLRILSSPLWVDHLRLSRIFPNFKEEKRLFRVVLNYNLTL